VNVVTEQPVLFGTERNLVGIVTVPDAGVAANRLGAIFLNAGVVHRVGPNRLYVNCARALAKLGFVSARFDLPGIGDSPPRRDAKPFEQAAVEETVQAMSDLEQRCGVGRFVLIGLCSGAVVSFNTALADARVVGTVLINPQGFGGSHEFISYVVGRGATRRYLQKLFSARSWRRALTGRSDYRHGLALLASLWKSARRTQAAVTDFSRDLAGGFRGLADRGVRVLLACSGGDYSLDYLEVIMGPEFKRLDRRGLHSATLPSGDHSLTMWRSQQMFLETLQSWALTLAEAERPLPRIAPSPIPEPPPQMARATAGGASQ
jgi:pimeloyl-ACP methyl ester carboxylesterase